MNELSLMNQAASALVWPPHILIEPVFGDAMFPTFKEGDFVAVDTNQRDLREGVYLIKVEDLFVLRRVLMPAGNKVLVSCDNKLMGEPMSLRVDSLSEAIVGRVIFAETRVY